MGMEGSAHLRRFSSNGEQGLEDVATRRRKSSKARSRSCPKISGLLDRW